MFHQSGFSWNFWDFPSSATFSRPRSCDVAIIWPVLCDFLTWVVFSMTDNERSFNGKTTIFRKRYVLLKIHLKNCDIPDSHVSLLESTCHVSLRKSGTKRTSTWEMT